MKWWRWYNHVALIGCALSFVSIYCTRADRDGAGFILSEAGLACSIVSLVSCLFVYRRMRRELAANAEREKQIVAMLRDLEERHK